MFLGSVAPLQKFLKIDPAVSSWLLVPGLILCIALVIVLYRAQSRIAPARLVRALTLIRVILIALVFGMLLRPLWVWSQTVSTPSTLWVFVDQSASMGQVDPQATEVEKFRWADVEGLLPKEAEPSRLGREGSEVLAIRGQWQHLMRSKAEATQFRALNDRLKSIANRSSTTAKIRTSPQATSIARDLQAAGQLLEQTPSDSATIERVNLLLESISSGLDALATESDADLIRQQAHAPLLAGALAKVSQQRRADLLVASLNGAGPSRAMRQLLESQHTRILAFGTGQKMVGGENPAGIFAALKTAAEPVQTSTDLAAALRFVSDQISDGEPASILVLSDGRSNVGGDPSEAARHLAARGVRVFTLAVGSRELATDAAVESLDAPDWIYKDDTLRVSAAIRLDGLAGKAVQVQLLRAGAVLDTKTITPDAPQSISLVNFQDKPPTPDVYAYQVHIVPVPGEAVLENNEQSFRVAVKKEKLQVLVIEDQPRWEYRYLVNYLKRDNRVHVQSILLEPAQVEQIAAPAAVKASPTNPTEEAQVLPQTPQEWAAFDLIVLGDVPPEFLTTEAQQNIAKAVRDRGAAMIAIAGPLNLPMRFAGTPLAEMLPMGSGVPWPSTELTDHLRNGFRIAIAPEGAASVLSQFGQDESETARLWATLPDWYWHTPLTQAKASASVLWQIAAKRPSDPKEKEPVDALAAARSSAMLTTMPLGLGRVMYLASDSTWRLRQVAGENIHERFWGQVIRWVAGSDMPAGGKFVRFGAGKAQCVEGQPIEISARILKKDYSTLTGSKFKVLARRGDKHVAEAAFEDSPQSPGLYHAQLKDIPPGTYDISLQGAEIESLLNDDPTVAQKSLTVDVISQSAIEHRNVNADRTTLANVAREGDGISLDAEYADVLADFIPQTRHEQTFTRQFGMFADPGSSFTRTAHWGFLGLFVLLISAEWILRKAGGLV